jgi:hypothetical protein
MVWIGCLRAVWGELGWGQKFKGTANCRFSCCLVIFSAVHVIFEWKRRLWHSKWYKYIICVYWVILKIFLGNSEINAAAVLICIRTPWIYEKTVVWYIWWLISQFVLGRFWCGLLHMKGNFEIQIMVIAKYHDYVMHRSKIFYYWIFERFVLLGW